MGAKQGVRVTNRDDLEESFQIYRRSIEIAAGKLAIRKNSSVQEKDAFARTVLEEARDLADYIVKKSERQ